MRRTPPQCGAGWLILRACWQCSTAAVTTCAAQVLFLGAYIGEQVYMVLRLARIPSQLLQGSCGSLSSRSVLRSRSLWLETCILRWPMA